MTTKKATTKKAWRKPKLTVLVRGKPEEMVLVAGCKMNVASPTGINGVNTSCTAVTACSGPGS